MGFLSSVAKAVAGPIVSGLFSKSSAKQQMDFQQYNSNTAHQREIADLRAAGLNPILSAKYGGASTPPGAGYQIPEIKLPEAFTQTATAKNLEKQGEVLDTQVTSAGIVNGILKEFPEIAIAQQLAGTSTSDKIWATMLSRGKDVGQKLIEKGSSSAKEYKKHMDEYDGLSTNPDYPFTIEIPYDDGSKNPKKKTREEIKKEYQDKTSGMSTREKQEFYRNEFRKYWRQ